MGNRPIPEETGLTFYSKISASISHELKNALAVINESAGFLEDVTLMAKKGVPLDPGRLGSLAGTILKQVQRANTIIKNMNRLAHSLDEKQAAVDISSLLELMLRVSDRIAVNRGIEISSTTGEDPISINTCPFFLETLIWLLLDLSMDTCGTTKKINVSAKRSGAGAEIVFSGLMELAGSQADELLNGKTAPLLHALGAKLRAIEEEGRLIVSLPAGCPALP
ncbi:MAG: histidine kinase dimerization/phospho-acceptor domain-containing protein [Thermodesulfobacteriota bacterium]